MLGGNGAIASCNKILNDFFYVLFISCRKYARVIRETSSANLYKGSSRFLKACMHDVEPTVT